MRCTSDGRTAYDSQPLALEVPEKLVARHALAAAWMLDTQMIVGVGNAKRLGREGNRLTSRGRKFAATRAHAHTRTHTYTRTHKSAQQQRVHTTNFMTFHTKSGTAGTLPRQRHGCTAMLLRGITGSPRHDESASARSTDGWRCARGAASTGQPRRALRTQPTAPPQCGITEKSDHVQMAQRWEQRTAHRARRLTHKHLGLKTQPLNTPTP